MIGYHFTGTTLRDGRPIPDIGEWLEHHGSVDPCVSGLHASEHPFDALKYARGAMLHRVELEGDLVPHGDPIDKWCGRRRRIIASIDITDILREYARWCAMQVVHLWNAPPVVIEYLQTGNESLRTAARAAARAAARDSARDSARTAAWNAVRDSAWDSARTAALAAVWAAVWDAAWDAVWDAVWDAAWDAYRAKFRELVEGVFAKVELSENPG